MKNRIQSLQSGYSLIELMIAITLGVVLSFAASNLFLQAKRSYLEDEEYARLQENGRYALRLLSRELAMAGYFGGTLRGENITTSMPPPADLCFVYLMVTGVPFGHHNDVDADGVGDTSAPAACRTPGAHQPGSDMLVIRRTVDRPHVLAGTLQAWQPGLAIDPDDVYLRKLEYNESVTLVRGSNANYGGLQVDIWRYEPELLFIRSWSRTAGDGIPVLCRKTLPSLNTECLVEGVENLQVEFGIDADGDQRVDRFVAAPSSTELADAIAARIYILVRSIGTVAGFTNDRSYTLGTTSVAAANDEFYRRVFQTTVKLRNSKAFKL